MSKTVWVIEKGSYSDYRVLGVFSSEENANIVADKMNAEDVYEKATVSEWPLDPIVNELQQGRVLYKVYMLKDGTTESVNAEPGEFDDSVCIWRRSTVYINKNIPDILVARVWAKDETHAIKIANEHRTRLIASKEWK